MLIKIPFFLLLNSELQLAIGPPEILSLLEHNIKNEKRIYHNTSRYSVLGVKCVMSFTAKIATPY